MSDTKLYTIVIPTRERHDVLRHSLRSALAQTSPNFEVIVMDNCSSPQTKEVVDSLPDPRVKYVRSPKRLAMSDNWELALEHVSGDYVFYLGDDDGILPDAVQCASRLHGWNPEQILAWMPAIWWWPDTIIEPWRNFLQMNLSLRAELRESRKQLQRLYNHEVTYQQSPSIYSAFVPTPLIRKLQKQFGSYFVSYVPDIISSIVNLCSTSVYIYSFRPLSVWGASKHSTGVSASYRQINNSSASSFEQENAGRWNTDIDPSLGEGVNPAVVIADLLLKAKERLFRRDKDIRLNIEGVIRSACEGLALNPDQYERRVAEILALARRHGIEESRLTIPPIGKGPERLSSWFKMVPESELVTLHFYTDPECYRTVDKVAALVMAMNSSVDWLSLVDTRVAPAPKGSPEVNVR